MRSFYFVFFCVALILISACKKGATDSTPIPLHENSIWPTVYEIRDAVYKESESKPEIFKQITKDLIENWKPSGKEIKIKFRIQVTENDCSSEYIKECEGKCREKEVSCVNDCIGEKDYFEGCYDWWVIHGVAIGDQNIVTYLSISIVNGDSGSNKYLEYHPTKVFFKELETPAQDTATCQSLRNQTGLGKDLVKKLFENCQ